MLCVALAHNFSRLLHTITPVQFVSHVTLDGIDVREELVVLSYKQLMVARKLKFPEAKKFALQRDVGNDDETINDSTHRRSKHVSERQFSIEELR